MNTLAPDATAPAEGFSTRLRRATLAEHKATEASPFVRRLLSRRLPIDGYAGMTAQWWFLYGALEREVAAHRTKPILAAFVDDDLCRLDALASDLDALLGADWRAKVEPLRGTEAYVERLGALADDWPAGLLAHHYLRYMGDLSGGQIIAKVVRRAYGPAGDAATRFYAFERIPDLAAYKATYRGRLDRVELDATGRQRLIDEVDLGYRLTERIFAELDRSFPGA